MMRNRFVKIKKRILPLWMGTCILSSFLGGCAVMGREESSSVNVQEADSVETLLSIDDPEEKAAVEAAKAKVAAMGEEPRIIATSPATADICDRLDLDLVGVCSSTISALPKRYEDLTQVGTAMSPDMEIISSLDPDWILSPVTLQSDLQPKYEAIHTE